jgi:PKD repeat protein
MGCDNPQVLFEVYKENGENRIPVYKLQRKQGDNYEYYLSNGELDAYNARDYKGFSFISNNPMFWTPATLMEEEQLQTPNPNFTFTPQNATAPTEVTFTNTTQGVMTSWYWDFGDGQTSKDKNPKHTYPNKGNYTVKLMVANQTKTATKTKTVTIQPSPMESLRNTYRFYCYSMKSHFFTISNQEKNNLKSSSNWRYEGVAFKAHYKQEPNTIPVYRFYHKGKGHFYTASTAERNSLWGKSDWVYEGTAFWAYSWNYKNTKPVYRLYSSKNQSHFYTTSWAEAQSAQNGNAKYKYEGIAFWVY